MDSLVEDRIILSETVDFNLLKQGNIRWIVDINRYGLLETPYNYNVYQKDQIITTNYFPLNINADERWCAQWQLTTRRHLEEAAIFIRDRVRDYPEIQDLNFLVYGPEDECVAVLFAFLAVYYRGNFERVKEHMLKRDPCWSLKERFGPLFINSILFPLLAAYNSECIID